MRSALSFLDRPQWRQAVLITLVALAIFVIFRILPTGTNLSHMDFRANGKNSIEFCDPANPQFISVVEMRSPVTLALASDPVAREGVEFSGAVALRTASDKAITAGDLWVTHTRKLHLLIVDPTLGDYQHVHPTPVPGTDRWQFRFTPQRRGHYRIFADFTPVATGRGLYASTDLPVAASGGADLRTAAPSPAAFSPLPQSVAREGYRFTLTTATQPIRAGQMFDFTFTVLRPEGGTVPLEPVMGAFAHLVAFDEARSGFAHLHPMESDLLRRPDPVQPTLTFKITIPRAGRYVIWAQVNLGGREVFVPFAFEVEE